MEKEKDNYKPEPLNLLYAWNTFKRLFPVMILWTGIMVLIVVLRLDLIGVLGILIGVQVVFAAHRFIKTKRFDKKQFIKGIARTILIVTIIYVFFHTIGLKYAVGGYIAFIIGFALYRIILGRKQYLKVIRDVESHIWGKPLEKKYWKDGEWRSRKNGKNGKIGI